MRYRVKKWMAALGLALAMVCLANGFYAPEVIALEDSRDSILTIYPELTTDDGRIVVGVCLTYQESMGIFTGMSVQYVHMDPSVTYMHVQSYYLSEDKKMAYVSVIYDYVENGIKYTAMPILYKTVP